MHKMDEALYILIERYLAGDLDPKENKAFEDRIKSDQDLAEKVSVYRFINEDLRSRFSREEDEQRLRENLQAIAKAEITARPAKVISIPWYYWAAAASIALLVITWFYATTPALPQYSQYAQHDPLSLSERGDDSLKHLAENAFNAAKYEEAIQRLDTLLKLDPDNIELQLYKAIALLELNRYEKAESILRVIKNSTTVYRDKATWYLALSALKQNNYDTCKVYLRELSPDSENQNEAEEILKRL